MANFRKWVALATVPLGFLFVLNLVINEDKPAVFLLAPLAFGAFMAFFLFKR